MADNPYEHVIPWFHLKRHIEMELESVDARIRHAKGEEIFVLQGKAQQLETFLRLPETLAIYQEADEQEKKTEEKKHADKAG